jgi:predicted flap endonuclease-1-like 5' DNA nuclease
MLYLIEQMAVWLLLVAVFAGLAGWHYAAERAAPAERALRRDRDNLLRDVMRLAAGEGGDNTAAVEAEREVESLRRLMDVRDGRIAELERALENARARADDAASEVAELQRRLEAEEGARQQAAAQQSAPAPAEDDRALQVWRLRYFEQRVRYLETQARMAVLGSAAPAADAPLMEWRAREAEARAAHLAQELRALSAPAPEAPAAEPAPFAADVDVDMLLRWRMLYLERRVSHLQAQAKHEPAQQPTAQLAPEAAPDPDRWKWRARYLEARVRHLEQRVAGPAEAAAPMLHSEPEAPAAPPPPRGSRPPVLSAPRNGAPDDLTLIDGVSAMQQSTLYALGVFHFDQIASWSAENVAWVDQYLRLRGRIDEEEWLEQAGELVREGPGVARRTLEDERL